MAAFKGGGAIDDNCPPPEHKEAALPRAKAGLMPGKWALRKLCDILALPEAAAAAAMAATWLLVRPAGKPLEEEEAVGRDAGADDKREEGLSSAGGRLEGFGWVV